MLCEFCEEETATHRVRDRETGEVVYEICADCAQDLEGK